MIDISNFHYLNLFINQPAGSSPKLWIRETSCSKKIQKRKQDSKINLKKSIDKRALEKGSQMLQSIALLEVKTVRATSLSIIPPPNSDLPPVSSDLQGWAGPNPTNAPKVQIWKNWYKRSFSAVVGVYSTGNMIWWKKNFQILIYGFQLYI